MEFFGFDLSALLPFIAIGFVAQLVDGAIGMAFGVITNTLLITGVFGMIAPMAPAHASARVHLVEMFTTAASGISHVLHKNVDWKLFSRLAIPGVIGGVLGAYILTNIDAEVAKPFVMAYLAGIGVYLLYRAWGYTHVHRQPKIIAPLGLIGGFLDAAGGGGWGPVVTSNLLIQGSSPRMTNRRLTDIHRAAWLAGVYGRDFRIDHRRPRGRAAGRLPHQANPAAAAVVAGWRRAHGDEPLQPLQGACLIGPLD
jgi:Sulfite exporter TauE/SafE